MSYESCVLDIPPHSGWQRTKGGSEAYKWGMDGKDVVEALGAARVEKRESALEENMLAIAVADKLAQGRQREDIEETIKFLQLVQSALRTYM